MVLLAAWTVNVGKTEGKPRENRTKFLEPTPTHTREKKQKPQTNKGTPPLCLYMNLTPLMPGTDMAGEDLRCCCPPAELLEEPEL